MNRRALEKSAIQGFTLVELLTVISIIAALAAILFPVFASARKDGQARVCTSNLHQLGLGIQMYAADWDDGIPFAPDPGEKNAVGNSTTSSDPYLRLVAAIPYDVRAPLAPYGCVGLVWRCPLDRYLNNTPPEPPTFFQLCGSSYWYDDLHALTGWTLADYTLPSQNVMMTDCANSDLDSADTKGVNLLFADFHVKIYTWEERNAFLNAQDE